MRNARPRVRKLFKIVKINVDKIQLEEIINNFISYLNQNGTKFENQEVKNSFDIFTFFRNKVIAENLRLTASQKKQIVLALNQNNFGTLNSFENYISDKK